MNKLLQLAAVITLSASSIMVGMGQMPISHNHLLNDNDDSMFPNSKLHPMHAPTDPGIMPVSDTEVGSLPGDFKVSPTGAASYSIPIRVPPGTANIAPALAISYDSHSPNGLLGVGFSLQGLTAITRCSSTVAQNGVTHLVDYTDSDRFCLNGEQLIALHGNYGSDQTEYRTTIDSQTKIISYGRAGNGPSYFKIWTKGGQVAEYGISDESKNFASGKPTIASWGLNKITDTVGNYETIHYAKGDGVFYPTTIEYTANDASGLKPYNKLELSYEDRPDIEKHYRMGSQMVLNKRLSQIAIYAEGNLTYNYKLSYEKSSDTKRSRLIKVQECGFPQDNKFHFRIANNERCMKPTEFHWAKTDYPSFEQEPNYKLPAPITIYDPDHRIVEGGVRFVDLRGQGMPDVIASNPNMKGTWFNTGSNWSPAPDAYKAPVEFIHYYRDDDDNRYYLDNGVRFVDLEGHGYLSIVQNLDGGDKKAWINRGKGFEPINSFIPKDGIARMDGQDSSARFADVTGDGKMSMFTDRNAWLIQNGDWQAVAQYKLPFPIVINKDEDGIKDNGVRFIDLMGRGKSDVIIYSGITGQRAALLNNGNGWSPAPNDYLPPVAFTDGDGKDVGVRFVDLTGDGLLSIVQNNPKTGAKGAWLNTGAGFVPASDFAPPVSTLSDSGTQFADLNNDGKMDILSGDGNVYFNNGHGWDIQDSYHLSIGGLTGDPSPTLLFDYSGSGIPGILQNGPNDRGGMIYQASLRSTLTNPDKLTGITDGLGLNTTIEYKPITDNSVYTFEEGSEYPTRDFKGAMLVVAKTLSDTDKTDPTKIGGDQHVTLYHYTGAKMNMQGAGFLGFRQVQATDEATGLSITTTYSQDLLKHLEGHALTMETRTKEGTLLTQIANDWDVKTHDGIYYPYVKTETKKSYTLAGKLVSTQTTTTELDDYANPTLLKKITEDETGTYETDTINTYINDPNRWILGELMSAKVTMSAPNTPPISRESSFTYDANGLLKETIVEPNDSNFTHKETYDRNQFGNIIKTTISGSDITDRVTEQDYDPYGRYVVKIKNAEGEVTESKIDPRFGTPLATIDSNGLSTQFIYDSFGRPLQTIHPDGTVTSHRYFWFNHYGCALVKAHEKALLNYRKLHANEPVVIRDPLKYAVYVEYNDGTEQMPRVIYYDKLNREVAKTFLSVNGNRIWQTTQYDELGRSVEQSQPYDEGQMPQYNRVAYDVLGRMKQMMRPNGSTLSIAYDGMSETTINPKGQSATQVKNARGDIVKAIDHDNHETKYKYDAAGHLIDLTDSVGHHSLMTYDRMGRKIEINDPDKGHWSYHYNVLGELLSQTDAMDQTTSFQYDKLGRMISRTDPAGTSAWIYGKDSSQKNVGKIIAVDGVANSSIFARKSMISKENLNDQIRAINDHLIDYHETLAYDNLGRTSSTTYVINGQPYQTNYTYDSCGRLRDTTYPSGIKMRHYYNDLGYYIGIMNRRTIDIYWILEDVDPKGRVRSELLGNGYMNNYTYDPVTELMSDQETFMHGKLLTVKNPAVHGIDLDSRSNSASMRNSSGMTSIKSMVVPAVIPAAPAPSVIPRLDRGIHSQTDNSILKMHYSYDVLGNIENQTDDILVTKDDFSYDNMNRLISWRDSQKEHTYAYDEIGNMTYQSDLGHYTYGPEKVHAVAAIEGVNKFTYDKNGNQIASTLGDHSRTIAYTSFDKPKEIVTPKATIDFYYNADREMFMRVDRTSDQTVTTLYLGDYIVESTDKNGSIKTLRKHLAGPAVFVLDENNNGESYYLHQDRIGSLVMITDNNGNIIQRFKYNPFGKSTQVSGALLNPITHEGFTGHEMIESADLIHMGGRLYDPILGRFLSADPIIQAPENSQSLNRYSYCLNNPLSLIDPSGYSWWSDLWDDVKEIVHDVGHAIDNVIRNEYGAMIIELGLGILAVATGGIALYALPILFSGYQTYVSDGTLYDCMKSMFLTTFSMMAWGATGTFLGDKSNAFTRIAAHGVVGGGLSAAEGRGFVDGALAGAAGEAVMGRFSPIDADGNFFMQAAERVTAAAVVGGTVAALEGGDFTNGAMTAAYGELYNDCMHEFQEKCQESQMQSQQQGTLEKTKEALKVEVMNYIKEHGGISIDIGLSVGPLGIDFGMDATPNGYQAYVGYSPGEGANITASPVMNYGKASEGVTVKFIATGNLPNGIGGIATLSYSKGGFNTSYGITRGIGERVAGSIGWTFKEYNW